MKNYKFLFAGSLLVTAGLALQAIAAPVGPSSLERDVTRQLNIDARKQPEARVAVTAGASILSSIANPPSKIATASVLDMHGRAIGAVQRVEVSAAGLPMRVTVALDGKGDKVVTLDAAAVSYDAARNEITAQASAETIQSLARRG